MTNARMLRGAVALTVATSLALTGCAPEDGPDQNADLKPGTIGGLDEPSTNGVTMKEPDGAEPAESDDGEKTARPEFEGENGDITPDLSGRVPVDVPRESELPESFPTDVFPLPAGITIYDAGERSSSAWFAVLECRDFAEADELLRLIVAGAGLSITEELIDADGALSASARAAHAEIDALSLRVDGKTLLSLELQLKG